MAAREVITSDLAANVRGAGKPQVSISSAECRKSDNSLATSLVSAQPVQQFRDSVDWCLSCAISSVVRRAGTGR